MNARFGLAWAVAVSYMDNTTGVVYLSGVNPLQDATQRPMVGEVRFLTIVYHSDCLGKFIVS